MKSKCFLPLALVFLGTVPCPAQQPTRVLAVYRPDGTRQCEKTPGIALETVAKELKAAGATVLVSKKSQLPMMMTAECGTPTGAANYFEIALPANAKLSLDGAAPNGFSLWPFEEPTRVVGRYDGELQCVRAGISMDSTAKLLVNTGATPIEQMILSSRNGMNACQTEHGKNYAFRIKAGELASAVRGGFQEKASRPASECSSVVAPGEGTPQYEMITGSTRMVSWAPDASQLREMRVGKIQISFFVNTDGTVSQVTVDRELSPKSLAAITSSIGKALFVPAVYDGCYVRLRGTLSFSYK